jgi:GNAT superfamily N-acetyltransferase
MSQARPAIVDIASVPASALADLHVRYLVTPFCGRPGRKLLELYYDTLTRRDDAFGLAAVVGGEIAGYACVVRDPRSVQLAALRRAPVRLAWWALAQVAVRPRLLARFAARLHGAPRGGITWRPPEEMKDWWPYRPLIVAEPYRQYGVADVLMDAVLAEARRRGVPGLIGTAERTNARSRVNLVRGGYREVWRNDEYVVLVKPVEPPDDGLQHSR